MRIVTAACSLIAAAAVSLALSPASLAAEPALANPGAVTEVFTTANVTEILTALGAQEVGVRDVNNRKIVDFKSGEARFHAGLNSCDDKIGGCYSMVMIVAFEGASPYSLESFNSFNREYPFVSATKLEGNVYAVTRMLIAQGGITKQNIAINLASFAQAPAVIGNHLASQVVAGVQQNGGRFQPVGLATGKPMTRALSTAEITYLLDRVKTPASPSLDLR
jgi:Putative bacterial sensory transduction regulator